MRRYDTDDQLDQAFTDFMADRGATIAAAVVPASAMATRIGTRRLRPAASSFSPGFLVALLAALLLALLVGAGLLIGSQPGLLGQGAFIPTGQPRTPRQGHTATLLRDGRVLIVGGTDDGNRFPNAAPELWDPAKGTFSSALAVRGGPMGTSPTGHTATRLEDGDVLIVGGSPNDEPGAGVQLWDHITRTAREMAPLTVARSGHTATLLRDGRVLIVGGLSDTGSPLDSVEVWDPETETFTVGRPLATARYQHTATLLPDGRVLVAGGEGGPDMSGLTSVETWDPVTEAFTDAGLLVAPRGGHTATLLRDGRVLVLGGFGLGQPGPGLASAEIWDPATGRSSPAEPPPYGLAGHTATLLRDGRVLVVGGHKDDFSEGIAGALLWDPSTGSFSTAGPPLHGYADHAATLLANGQVLVEGAYVDGYTSHCGLSPAPTQGGYCPVHGSITIFAAGAELFDPTGSLDRQPIGPATQGPAARRGLQHVRP